MSALTASKPENISNLLVMDQEYPAPEIVARNTIQKDWLGECARSLKDPEGFWADYAARFVWSRKWDRVLEWDGVHHKWFTGAKTKREAVVTVLERFNRLKRLERLNARVRGQFRDFMTAADLKAMRAADTSKVQ